MTRNNVEINVPDLIVFHSEELKEIRMHTSSYIHVSPSGKEFLARSSCHAGYISPVLNVTSSGFLWDLDSKIEAVSHLGILCREKFQAMESAGFTLLDHCTARTEFYKVESEFYLAYGTALKRSTERVRDIWKELRDRSKLLLTGKRSVPSDLQERYSAFAREVLCMRACAGDEETFRAGMISVLQM